MAEIKINISQMEVLISQMKGFASTWSGNNTDPPATVGGGKTVNEFEEFAKVYKDLNTQMITLASNTASFLENIKTSYVESDKKSATEINRP